MPHKTLLHLGLMLLLDERIISHYKNGDLCFTFFLLSETLFPLQAAQFDFLLWGGVECQPPPFQTIYI